VARWQEELEKERLQVASLQLEKEALARALDDAEKQICEQVPY
jgi:hypothetical protein